MLCECGCGQLAPLAQGSCASRGYVKGQPKRFILGHGSRLPVRYELQDCGYETPCWIWQGSRTGNGYGRLIRDGQRYLAHRWMYQARKGSIPGDLPLDHLCRVTLCVNPEHLEPVTPAENNRRQPGGLSWEAVEEIRERLRAALLDPPQGRRLFRRGAVDELAAEFEVSRWTIYDVRTRAWQGCAAEALKGRTEGGDR